MGHRSGIPKITQLTIFTICQIVATIVITRLAFSIGRISISTVSSSLTIILFWIALIIDWFRCIKKIKEGK